MNYNITLTQQELSIVAAALNEAPYRIAAPLIANIQKQVTAQEQPQAEPEVVDTAE